ncbi:MAG TPA: tetratricopeptide repeat protein [Rhizomicrobium sp.]|nr:tetratricopeptide repeat protein [Rhizomicrobium sp.]
MHRTVALALCLVALPATAFAVGSGMGMYGTASFGGGGGGNSSTINAQEEYAQATRLMDKQDYEDAIRHLLRVNSVEQGNAEILNDLGYATRMTGDYDTSLDYLQRAIVRNPDLKIAYANLGMLYLSMHKPDEAHQQLDALKRLCPRGCEEQDNLSQSIAAYDAAAKTPAGSTGTASPK